MKSVIYILTLFLITLTLVHCNFQEKKEETKQVIEVEKASSLIELSELQIDHVIYLVNDIDSATHLFTKKGFTIKKGRLHKNGLINGHIKFKNNTSIELMSLEGAPSDEISNNYLELLKGGEGGVFISISGIETSEMEEKLNDLEIQHTTIVGKNWNYITFPETSSLAHFFFIENKFEMADSIHLLTHKNESEQINEVWIEGDKDVLSFLNGLGLKPNGRAVDSELGEGERFLTRSGEIIVIPNKVRTNRPRIKLITLGDKSSASCLKIRF